jgi:hypothetical protein
LFGFHAHEAVILSAPNDVKVIKKAYSSGQTLKISSFDPVLLDAKTMFKKARPFALPRLDLPSEKEWLKLFSSTAVRSSPQSVAVKSVNVEVPCDHWGQVLRHHVNPPLGHIMIRHFSTLLWRADFEPLLECEHSLLAVMRGALKGIELWPQAGLEVTCVLVKSLAVVMTKRLDRDHPLWTKVLDWIVKCINNPMEGEKIVIIFF